MPRLLTNGFSRKLLELCLEGIGFATSRPDHRKWSFPRRREPKGRAAQRLESQVLRQVAPARIGLLDQCELPCPVPFLDPLFPDDCRFHRRMPFEPDEQPHPISAREPGQKAMAMPVDAACQGRCHAHIERAVPAGSEQVHGRAEIARHAGLLLGSRLRGNDEWIGFGGKRRQWVRLVEICLGASSSDILGARSRGRQSCIRGSV